MATPVGPVAPDPNDPDRWDEWYGQDDDDVDRGRLATPVRLLALLVAVGMVLLVVVAR
ncbi:MAG: hypothetical protein M3256_07480 [Actinomycetota bacterium]|nr:hypothetical protein [Actinomycetota bacterium]MDQ6946103.1 hypothetical protein [Actinomycetota bacterium]